MRLMPALTAVAAVALVACGAVGGGGQLTHPPVVATPTAALAQWAGFPANQKPRPIILFWELYPSGGGFTNGDSKLAAICNKFSLGTTLPTVTPAQGSATWPGGATAPYNVISASEAYAAITKPRPDASPDMCGPPAPVKITSIRFATATFRSDRGTVQMSAWLFGSPTVMGELSYPALSPSAFWRSGFTVIVSTDAATISADGLALTFGFTGAAPASTGSCGADYTAVIAESGSAVAVAVQEVARSVPDGPVVCDLMGHSRSLTVTLASPLGGRVVVNASGDAIPVCPDSKPNC